MTSDVETAVELRNRQRIESLARGLYRPISQSIQLDIAVAAMAALIGGSVALLTMNLAAAVAAAAVGLASGGLIAWAWLGNASNRASFELISDHDCHELAEWKTETGTNMPRTLKAARAWLRDHPDTSARATMLARLGRLAEARAVIDAAPTPDTPEMAFGRELQRQTILLYEGGRPDVMRLHADWPSLPDPRERRHRRECLAILDAQIALAEGADGWSVLAGARAEVGDVHPSQRASRFALRLVAFHALALLSFSGVLVIAYGWG